MFILEVIAYWYGVRIEAFKVYTLSAISDRSLFMARGVSGSKVGVPRKFFGGERVGIEKILRSPERASKFFFLLKLSPLARHHL